MARFNVGQTVMTRGIAGEMSNDNKFARDVHNSFLQYATGDWGTVCEDDKMANEEALENGDRLMGAYETVKGKIWIITEWDRSVTTILFPEEY